MRVICKQQGAGREDVRTGTLSVLPCPIDARRGWAVLFSAEKEVMRMDDHSHSSGRITALEVTSG